MTNPSTSKDAEEIRRQHASIQDVLEGRARWAVALSGYVEAMATVPPRGVDVVLTDPPFTQRTSDGARSGQRDDKFATVHERKIDFGGIDGWESELAAGLLHVARRWVVVFCALEQLAGYQSGAPDSWVRAGVWDKCDTGAPQFTGDRPAQAVEALAIMHAPGRKRWNGGGGRGIWRHMVEKERLGHPTPKPLPLMLELVEQFTEPDEIVLDPFCGSGTTGVACLRLGRRFIGIDHDPRHAQLATDRLLAESRGLSLRAARAGQLPMFADLET